MEKLYQITEEPIPETDSTMPVARTLNGDYIGNPEKAVYLCDERGIKPEKAKPNHGVCSIGFSEKDGKWYGWSHRAIYGFGVGSKVAKGDCAYTADIIDDLYEDYIDFFGDVTPREKIEGRLTKDRDNNRVWVAEKLIAAPVVSTGKGIKLALYHPELMPEGKIKMGGYWLHTGRGEWTATTMEDARQMACDFAEGVS